MHRWQRHRPMRMQWWVLLLSLVMVGSTQSVPAKCLDPRDFGAVEGNSPTSSKHWQNNTMAIQAAIDTPTATCVAIVGGDFVTSDLVISQKSNFVFQIERGSRLLTAVNHTTSAVLNVSHVTNVTISGQGVVHGSAEHYISYYQPDDNRFEPTAPDGARPNLLIIEESRSVMVRDLHFHNSSDKNIIVRKSSDVTIDGVEIFSDSRYPNTDGIHPSSATRLTVLNSRIDVADDGISPISTLADGPLTGLVVRNTTIRSKSHGIKFGSTCDALCSDCLFENITIHDSNSGLAIQQRGAGDIRNITFRDIKIETRYQAPRWWGNGEWLAVTVEPRHQNDTIGQTQNLSFEHISARSENGGLLSGLAGAGIQGVSFSDVNLTITRGIGNYSTGLGPPCCPPGGRGNITCMGTRDHRPSYTEDVACTSFGNCRVPGKADGFHMENVHDVLLADVQVRFEGHAEWYGACATQSNMTTGVVTRGSHRCDKLR